MLKLIFLLLISNNLVAKEVTFVGKVIETKYCQQNEVECQSVGNVVGETCKALVEFTGEHAGIGSVRPRRNGPSHMFIGGKPVKKMNLEIGDKVFKKMKANSPYMLHQRDFALWVEKSFQPYKASALFTRDENGEDIILREILFSTNKSDKNRFVYKCSFE